MRVMKWSAIAVAIALAFAGRALGQEGAGQRAVDMKSMSVAELEKAGDTYRAQKDYDRAIQYFQEAVRRDKKSATLRNKLGLAELAGNTELARMDFEKAAKLNPKFADAFNNVGAVYFMQNMPGPAAKYFKKAVALEETRAAFHVNLGAAWFNQKKFDRAINEYARALELDPRVLEQHTRGGSTAQIASPEERAKYNYMLAKIYAKRGDLDSCLVCLRKAKEDGYHDLANVYKEEEFSGLWTDARLALVVPPPVTK
jgi:tetratricopeptide (TPR) repeat protein